MIDSFYLTAFMMGLIGSGHCVAMCGGVASSLQLAVKDPEQAKLFTVLYNLGRLFSYSAAGALVAGVSSYFASQSLLLSQFLTYLSALFMVLVGLYVMRLAASLNWLESLGKAAVWRHLVKLNRYLMPLDSKSKALAYGALWGWLPCGLVYSALTWSVSAPSALEGALFMSVFALGTSPAMLSLGWTAQTASKWLNKPIFRLIMGNLLVFYGFYLFTIAVLKAVH